jgi:predicted phosphodiesterase
VRVAALYDIHGNAPALDAVLRDVPDDAEIVIGGDTVLGFDPIRTLELLDALGERAHWIRGNADRRHSNETDVWVEREDWVVAQIGEERFGQIASLSDTLTLHVDGLGPTLFCHGSPRSDEEQLTRVTSDERFAEILADVSESTVVCGHTHQQFDRRTGDKCIVNAGSIGLPYEGRPGAYWTLLGPDVQHRRTQYDFAAAAEALRTSGIPDPGEFVEWLFDAPPDPDEVAEFFEQRALEAARS